MTAAQKQRIHRASKAAAGIAASKAFASANPIGSLRVALRMPRSKFARLLGRTERAIIDWELGKSAPQGLSQQRLHEVQRLVKQLHALFDPKIIGRWFDTPNPAFGGLKPIEIIERGESDRLWQMIFQLKAGAHV